MELARGLEMIIQIFLKLRKLAGFFN